MSTADARDRAMDALLKRAAEGGPADGCLDANLLAAWAEQRLSGPALAQAEAHMADCARCQAAMAALVTSIERTPADAGAAAGASERSWWSVNLRWLVPLAGAATAAVLWAVVPERQPVSGDMVTAQEEALDSQRMLEPVGAPAAPAPEKATPQETSPPARLQSTPTRRNAGEAKGGSAREADAVGQARPSPAESRPDTRLKTTEAPAQAGTRPADAATVPPPAPAAAPAAPADARDRAARLEAAAAPPAELAKANASSAENAVARQLAAIASGDTSVRWRLAGPGAVERSRDAGASWERLETGTRLAFTAGAAPQADVCWLVGPDGAALLTTDARTWRRLAVPTREALVAVDATSGQAATVRTAGGAAFRTTDGGAQWTRIQ